MNCENIKYISLQTENLFAPDTKIFLSKVSFPCGEVSRIFSSCWIKNALPVINFPLKDSRNEPSTLQQGWKVSLFHGETFKKLSLIPANKTLRFNQQEA